MTTRHDINRFEPISGCCPDVTKAANREGQPMHKHTTHRADHAHRAAPEHHPGHNAAHAGGGMRRLKQLLLLLI